MAILGGVQTSGGCCCGRVVCCCPNRVMPRQLTATVRNAQFCSCLEGLTDTADFDELIDGYDFRFTSAAACGVDAGDQVAVIDARLECRQIDEVTCEWWVVYSTSCESGGIGGEVPLVSVQCDPFEADSDDILDVQCCNATSPDQGLFRIEFREV